jgi:hypothetical protein
MFDMPAVNYRGKIDDTYSGNNGTKFEDGANQSVLPCKRTPVYQLPYNNKALCILRIICF